MARRTIYVALQQRELQMVTDANSTAELVAEPATDEPVKSAPKAAKPAETVRKPAKKSRRKSKPARAKAQPKANKRNDTMIDQTKIFAGFGAFPNVFEKLLSDAAVRGEDAVKRSRKAAEELAGLYQGNVEAFAEAGKIAATGAQSIGQDLVAKGRETLEQTATTVRAFTEAKSPTELLQLQSDFARGAFDRFVEETSALTESMVKLAGEAFQPISNRASANVEKFNEIAA
jgi:phasin family protein